MISGSPRFLFVPVSGSGGAGEFMRSLIIARSLRQRWPNADIHFVVNAEAAYARELEFPHTTIQGSPTYNVAAVNDVLTQVRPHVVVFDSAGRVAQYRHAKALGVAVVYVSSRFQTRWKGFRLRRMRYFDQHWIAQPRFLDSELTRWEKLKLAVMRHVAVVFLDALFETVTPARQAQLLEALHLRVRDYVVLCLGSGGRYAQVRDPAAMLVVVAERVHSRTGLACVAVTGANAAAPVAPAEGVQTIASLPNGELIALLRGARVAVVNGGSLLLQTIANRIPAVAVPVAGDQADRIRRCAERNLVVPAAFDESQIEAAVTSLLQDMTRRAVLEDAMERLALGNGVSAAVDALAQLLERRGVLPVRQ